MARDCGVEKRQDNPSIAPEYRSSDWHALDLDNAHSDDWETAVSILETRIRARFLQPIDAIIDHVDPQVAEFSGFAIIALDCLLVETLGQFYLGLEQTGWRQAQAVFEEVLLGSKRFVNDFKSGDVVGVFRDHFRDGILHQAETKGQSLVRFGEPCMIEYVDAADVEAGLVVDRNRFHESLCLEFADYVEKLRDPTNTELRRRFRTKMDAIAKT